MDSLRRQLELTRFDRGREVIESMADHRALLTTSELARVNHILTGKDGKSDPVGQDGAWRQGNATIKLPSGRIETVDLIENPIAIARDKLHRATEAAENGNAIDAAVDIYAGLVLSHVFEDANRRTAVLAAHYFFRRYDVPLTGLVLHELGLGDLRVEGQLALLHETVRHMVKFAQKSRPKV
jgi:hypothetical protein